MNHQRRLSLQDHNLMFRRRALTDIKELDERRPEQASSEESLSSILSENAEHGNDNDENPPKMSSPLFQAVLENNIELLKKLVEDGADINELDNQGWPPLHTAIRSGKTECAAYLLKQGAGEFYYKKQKQEYLQRLEKSKSKTKTRKVSYWS